MKEIKTESLIKAVSYALLLAGLFYSSHRVMVGWWANEDYTYGYLIAPIVLYLLWEKRAELSAAASKPSWSGMIPLAFGIFLFWLGELAGEFTTLYFASWFVLAGLLWLHLGWEKLKIIWFPVVFIVAMFPPPNFIHINLTFKLKLLSSQIGVWILHLYGMSAYREGNIIDLGFTQLQVVDACSGLRYLYPLIIMGLLLAYFFKASLWKKAVLVASTVPLTIVTNSLRIAMTGILYEVWGPQVAEDFFHGFSGWLIFMFALAVLLVEMGVLNGLGGLGGFGSLGSLGGLGALKNGKKTTEDDPGVKNVHQVADAPDVKKNDLVANGWRALFHPPQFGVAVVLLAGTLAVAQAVEFREKVPMARSFADFPLEVGDWRGRREAMEQKFIEALTFKDYVMVDYADGSRKWVNFYTAFYDTQRKGESIHSPETCLPGGGWEFQSAGAVGLPFKSRNGDPIQVNRAFMLKSGAKQLSYFWFPMRGRVLTNAWEMKLYNFWDALTRQRTDGALVRLITPVYPGEGVEEADRRLTAFTKEIIPVLDGFLPR